MFAGLVTLTAVAVVWLRIDAIAQDSLEEVLTKELGVPVDISTLSINKLSGTAEIKRLSIQNPSGYSEPNIFQVQQIDVNFAPLSLLQDTIEIQTLKLNQTSVNFEQNLEDNNILQIVNYVKSRKSRRAGQQSKQQDDRQQVSAQFSFKQKRFEIDTVRVSDILVNAQFSPLARLVPLDGLTQTVKVQLPDIELEDVSSDNARAILEGTLEDVVAGLIGNLAGEIFQEMPERMESSQADVLLRDLIKQLPF
ncbi:MAG: AsmA family protein [Cyanobacteria bacterium P01_F01_bin.42]